ncbi:MAG: class I SAM-dependent methyltransferase, partial [Candidatus Uhrbacteria bacterium]|nr:class I SAM-dependent methyltransferase [Candidatus Uhrbacteria bacterium]
IGLSLLKKHTSDPIRVADFGAGKGEFLELVKKNFPTSERFGFDYSPTNLEELNRKGIHGVEVNFDEITPQTYKRLEELKGTFDVITTFAVVEHVFDTNSFLQLANFLLKKDGILICSTPNLGAYQMRFFSLFEGFPYGEGHHVRFFTFKRLHMYFFFNGFRKRDERSYFYYGISPIQKSTGFPRLPSALLSLLFFIPAFLLETCHLWKRATKGDLMVVYIKNGLIPLGVGKIIFQNSWDRLSEIQKGYWRLEAKKYFRPSSLNRTSDLYHITTRSHLWG